MHSGMKAFVLLALCQLASAVRPSSVLSLSNSDASRVIMEEGVFVEATPSWARHDRCTEAHTINTTLYLKNSAEQLKYLEDTFWAVSDPKNARYGQFLKQAEVTKMMAVDDASIAVVTNWLTEEKVDFKIAEHKDAVHVSLTAPQAERLFATEFYQFKHARGFATLLRAGTPYSLPAAIAEVVTIVGDIIRFPRINMPKFTEAPGVAASESWPRDCGSSCSSGWTTPAVLAERYKTGSQPTTCNSKNSFSVAEFQGQYYADSILSSFGSTCGVDNIKVDTLIGSNTGFLCQLGTCTESLLDIEYIKSIGGVIPLTDIYSSDYSLLNWGNQINDLSDDDFILVHSVSYGNDEVQQTGAAYMNEVNEVFQKVGVRGGSILIASGDQGVWGRTGPSAFGTFHPDFPAGSPYVTAVGGTDFYGDTIGEETTWTDGGGGFSDTFDMPSYQADDVAGYFSSGVDLPSSSKYNAKGRGYPDVAALGGVKAPYCVKVSGLTWGGVGGTSASCPVVSAIFAKLNDLRLDAGKSPLGFLNPFIYQNKDAFNDVIYGENKGEGSVGFKATTGWDPATGVGTPDFEKLAALM